MWPRSAVFDRQVRGSHAVAVSVTATHPTEGTQDLPVLAGTVAVSAARAVRRQLSLTTPATTWVRQNLMDPGVTITARRGIYRPLNQSELLPVGLFDPTRRLIRDGTEGAVAVITGQDVMGRVVRARFTTPTVTRGLAVGEALRLAGEAAGVSTRDDTTSTTTTRGAVWDRDRDVAVRELAASAGAVVAADPSGVIVATPEPDPDAASSWTIDAGITGVYLAGDRDEGVDRVYNSVVVAGGSVDGGAPFAPVLVADTEPTSPTYVGSPAVYRPYFITSDLIRTATQARRAGLAALRRITAPARQATVSTIPQPALDALDVVTVTHPDGTSDRHIVEALTLPLTVDGDMAVTMRSSRSDDPAGA